MLFIRVNRCLETCGFKVISYWIAKRNTLFTITPAAKGRRDEPTELYLTSAINVTPVTSSGRTGVYFFSQCK